MRIPGSKVYRAFPELDRFSDAQCARFLWASKRDWWVARLARLFAAFGAFAGSLLIGYGAVALLVWRFLPTDGGGSRSISEVWYWGSIMSAICGPVLIALLVALMTRDLFLRRRLRAVINDRAKCLGCGYSLLGLTVPENLIVNCPECGEKTEVDPALAELQEGATGKEFRPTIKVGPKVLTPKERKRRRRIAAAFLCSILAVLLSPVAVWGWFEWCFARDARLAAAEQPGMQALVALAATLPPTPLRPGAEDEPSAWAQLQKAFTLLAQAETAYRTGGTAEQDEQGNPISPDYGWVGQEPGKNMRDEDRLTAVKSGRAAERIMPALREAGVFDAMRAMRGAQQGLPINISASGSIQPWLTPELGQMRHLSRVNSARAAIALRSGDVAEYEDAVANMLQMARMAERYPSYIARLYAAAMDGLADFRIIDALLNKPDAQTLDAIDRLMLQRTPRVPLSYTLEAQRIEVVDAIAGYFSDADRVRGRTLQLLAERYRRKDPARVGRYEEARDTVNRLFANIKPQADVDRYTRKANGTDRVSDQEIMREAMPSLDSFFSAFDRCEVDRRGRLILCAIERYRLTHGEYPATLQALVPDTVASLPVDPFSGRPYSYKRIDAATDRLHRGYLLYTWGYDDTDNGGKEAEFYLDALTRRDLKGIDYIVNTK